MGKQKSYPVPVRQPKVLRAATADGGFVELADVGGAGGNRFEGRIVRGTKETPAEWRERKAFEKAHRNTRQPLAKHKGAKGGRQGDRQKLKGARFSSRPGYPGAL